MGPEDRQFPEFFVSQYGRLRRLGFLLTGSWAEGEELAQETLTRIYWRWSLVRRQEHPEAYARKVLVNRHRSLLRRLRLEARHAGRERAEPFDLGPHEELMVVRAAIRRLPARQRTVLVLRYHQDLPEQEVARLLRIPVGTVKSLSNRAMTRLRRDLERQGFELTLPKGWKVDQSTTASYAQFGQPWLVISPGGRPVSATENRRITIHTAVAPPSEYPGKPTKGGDAMGGQSFSTLAGAKSSGRRPDGRAFTVGDQGGLVGYHIAWPYRCEPADLCPEAGPWRVLELNVEGTGRQEGLKVRRVARQLVESIRPITNALAPAVAEEPGLFADAPEVVGRGGQGDYAWEKTARKGSGQDYWVEMRHQSGDLWYGGSYQKPAREEQQAMIHCAPSREAATAMVVEGYGSEAVAKVVLELQGRQPVEVATFGKEKYPFTFWVVAPLPPEARPLSFTSFDAAGRQIDSGTEFAGYPDCNP